MAEDKKAFLQGKMNLDVDDRILPTGEYREAQNIQITTSEGSDVGAIQNVKGNLSVSTVKPLNGLTNIGSHFDEKNGDVYYFLTDYTCVNHDAEGLIGQTSSPAGPIAASSTNNCFIVVFDSNTNQTKNLIFGSFLNFSTTNKITGVNLMEDILFWTDGLNQPRKINVKTAKSNFNYYNTEDKISVAKFAPFSPPLLLDYLTTSINGNIPTVTEPTSTMTTVASLPTDFLKERFVRFSYRFKFNDGEYSTIAPFTQICFIPSSKSLNVTKQQQIFNKGEISFQDNNGNLDGMVNSVNKIGLNIIFPSRNVFTDFEIIALEILYKESDNNLIRAVELIDIDDTDSVDGVYQYNYKSTLPYKTLPKDQLTRVYDNVPLSAQAQEVISNRVVYGNFIQDRKLPISNKKIVGLDFSTSFDVKYNTEAFYGNQDFNNYYIHKEYPVHSIKQRRTYELGVVLSDKFGRQSPVLTSTNSDGSVEVTAKDKNFFSRSWDNVGTVSSASPGNKDYCGDALEITFNKAIPNAYGQGTFLNTENATIIVSPSQTLVTLNTSISVEIPIGAFLKGHDKDFVKIVDYQANVIKTDGKVSLDYSKTDSTDLTYVFYYYTILTHGWYSYRVVVKQTEQEYDNVYTSGVFNFNNGTDGDKSYFTITGDNINKVTRDTEFANTQETGLSTSKNKLYPKVVLEGSLSRPTLSNVSLIDVVSVGTAKEQGLKNNKDLVYSFVNEAEKNPIVAQIPFGSTSNEFGQTINIESSDVTATANLACKRINQNKTLQILGSNQTGNFLVGEYLKGQNKDLVKILKSGFANSNTIIDCDGEVSDEYVVAVDVDASTGKYDYKYSKNDVLNVFETKPFESALDIYYETSTCGLVHELNELAASTTGASNIEFKNADNFNEGTLFWSEDENFNPVDFQNQYAASIEITDVAGTTLSGTNILSVEINNVTLTNAVAFNQPNFASSFDIIFDDNNSEWRIKPLVNFVHNNTFDNGNYVLHPTFNFDIAVTTSDGETTDFENIPLFLLNSQPIIDGGTSVNVILGTIEDNTLPIYNVLEFTVNGAATSNPDTNQEGLFFSPSTNLDGDLPAATNQGFIPFENSLLSINVNTGDIKITDPTTFNGNLDQSVTVRVYDSNDKFFFGTGNGTAYDDDNQGDAGGLFIDQVLNFVAGNGLIVIEPYQFITAPTIPHVSDAIGVNLGYKGPYAFETEGYEYEITTINTGLLPNVITYAKVEGVTLSFICGYMEGHGFSNPSGFYSPLYSGPAKSWSIDMNNLTSEGLPSVKVVDQSLFDYGSTSTYSNWYDLFPFIETNPENQAFESMGDWQTTPFTNLSWPDNGVAGGLETAVNPKGQFAWSTSDIPLPANVLHNFVKKISFNTFVQPPLGTSSDSTSIDPQGIQGTLSDGSDPDTVEVAVIGSQSGATGYDNTAAVNSGIENPFKPTQTTGGYPFYDFNNDVGYIARPDNRDNGYDTPNSGGFKTGVYLIKSNIEYVAPGSSTVYDVLYDVDKTSQDTCNLLRVFLCRQQQ